MVFDLTPGDWEKLTVEQRILRCREYAQEAEALAQAAHPDQKRQYKEIAGQWHQLAAELESFGRTERPLPGPVRPRKA